MADNYREETTTRKRGRAPSKLSVKLFLLDPDKNITKVTKEIGSEKGLNELRQKGYGPPSKGKYSWLMKSDPQILYKQIKARAHSKNLYRHYKILSNALLSLIIFCTVCPSVFYAPAPGLYHSLLFTPPPELLSCLQLF